MLYIKLILDCILRDIYNNSESDLQGIVTDIWKILKGSSEKLPMSIEYLRKTSRQSSSITRIAHGTKQTQHEELNFCIALSKEILNETYQQINTRRDTFRALPTLLIEYHLKRSRNETRTTRLGFLHFSSTTRRISESY